MNETHDPQRVWRELFGVQDLTDRPAVQLGYRRAVKRLHPDRNEHPDAAAQFRELQEQHRLYLQWLERPSEADSVTPPPPAGESGPQVDGASSTHPEPARAPDFVWFAGWHVRPLALLVFAVVVLLAWVFPLGFLHGPSVLPEVAADPAATAPAVVVLDRGCEDLRLQESNALRSLQGLARKVAAVDRRRVQLEVDVKRLAFTPGGLPEMQKLREEHQRLLLQSRDLRSSHLQAVREWRSAKDLLDLQCP